MSEDTILDENEAAATRTPVPSHADAVEASQPAGDRRLMADVRAKLARNGVVFTSPGPSDHVLLLRGMPVVPWVTLRPAAEVWSVWLQRLRELWIEWSGTLAAPDGARSDMETHVPADAPREISAWDSWQASHIAVLEAGDTVAATQELAACLADGRLSTGNIHVIGHSVGGAAVLAYLAGCREGRFALPGTRLRTAITLDAAVAGLAGLWSGTWRYLGARSEASLSGLGAWAAHSSVALLTACNERDLWSHRALADVPYLGLRLGPAASPRAQLNGSIHGWLRRTPQLVEALWGMDIRHTHAKEASEEHHALSLDGVSDSSDPARHAGE